MNPEYDLFIGWDIGGAHLKCAYVEHDGKVLAISQTATPIWNGLDVLVDGIDKHISLLRSQFPNKKIVHAVTMTAELSDVFSDRKTGVLTITGLIKQRVNPDDVYLYSANNGFVQADTVEQYVGSIASANWYATTSLLSQHYESGLLVDFGSTTTDIIPFENAQVIVKGLTDHERLATGELIYTGMIRTPIMAIVNKLQYQQQTYNVMAEHFATMADVYRITGDLEENDDDSKTADGAEKSMEASLFRVGRMIGLDANALNNDELQNIKSMAQSIADKQLNTIHSAIVSVYGSLTVNHDAVLIVAGCGRNLISKIAQQEDFNCIDFSSVCKTTIDNQSMVTTCAAAFSVAELLRLDRAR